MRNVGIQLGYVLARIELEHQMAEVAIAERQQLGRELHDSVSQQISAMGMLTAVLTDELADNQVAANSAELLHKLQSHIEKSQRQIQSLMVGLFPVDVEGNGLTAALSRLAAEVTNAHAVVCHFDCEGDVTLTNSFTATQLFLIASEATHNAAKHAHAGTIVIHLSNRDGVRVAVTDDGLGLPPDLEESSGKGLHIMRHRAELIEADFHLESPPDGGTMVTCNLPGHGVHE